MKKRYIIYAPPLCKSNGVRALYTLAKKLRERGFESFIFCPSEKEKDQQYITTIDQETRERDIVVYPEIVPGNPLRFQNVVRYILYYPGKLGGQTSFHQSEILFTWEKQYYKADELRVSYVDKQLFYDAKLPKTQDCYFVHKRGLWRDVPEIKGLTEINMNYPETKEELAKLLQTTNILYSFDEKSALNIEAHLCGAQVKIVTETGFTSKVDILESEQQLENLLSHFIQKTQAMQYQGGLEPYPLTTKETVRIYLALTAYPLLRILSLLLPISYIQKLEKKFRYFLQRRGRLGTLQ